MSAAATEKKARSRASILRRVRKDAGNVVALLATPDDFETMRRQYPSFRFTDYYDYLNQMQILLNSLVETSGAYVTLFDPLAFAAFCARERLEPDSPSSRSRYVVGRAIHDVGLPYDVGDEVTDVIEDLVDVLEKQLHLKRAFKIIGSSSLGGVPPYEFLDRARVAVAGLLHGLGTGEHHLVCIVVDEPEPLVARFHATSSDDGVPVVSEDDELAFTVHVAAALRSGGAAGITAHTTDAGGEAGEVARAWTISEGWLRPLSSAEVFSAYCTDPVTGAPIPPEHGVEYVAGFPVALPEQ